MSEGRPITLVPSSQELSTVEAAHFLNVSRPFVVKEIDAGRLAHRLVGTHRRVAFEDLIAYARKMREQQESARQTASTNTHLSSVHPACSRAAMVSAHSSAKP